MHRGYWVLGVLLVVVVLSLPIQETAAQVSTPTVSAYHLYLPFLQVERTPTATATPIWTVTATATFSPTATVSPCDVPVQVLTDPGFENGSADWLIIQGYASRASAYAYSGSYSMQVGGYNNSNDAFGQVVTVPEWASTGTLRFVWGMVSSESTLGAWDVLKVGVFPLTSNDVYLARGEVWNNYPRNQWRSMTLALSNVPQYRSQQIAVLFMGYTDSSRPTTWYLDDVEMRFGCE